MERFDYVVEKLRDAKFQYYPFKHIYIEDLFSSGDFAEIINSPEVRLPPVDSDEALVSLLHGANFKEILFPGTTIDIPAYLDWHKDSRSGKNLNQATCEGFGVTLRLQKTRPDSILAQTERLFRSDFFWTAAAAKFGVDRDSVRTDTGLQKYLDGYEISPHPDIRTKALTFMININPAPASEAINYHTSYLIFKPEREYVHEFWTKNQDLDRCWVPWDWCITVQQQRKNNSIVMFSPADDTLHAVKASYNHLVTQRTQFYGNLWYKDQKTKGAPNFEDFARMAVKYAKVDA
jgi:hypothetical protein